MYALGLIGILTGIMALLFSVFGDVGPRGGEVRGRSVALNYAVAQGAVQEAVFLGAARARALSAGEVFLAGTQCKAPLGSAVCDLLLDGTISADVAAHLPPEWKVLSDKSLTPRWKGRIQNRQSLFYGAVSLEEMAALRQQLGNTATFALCKGGAGGGACMPPLQNLLPDGTLAPLVLPPEIGSAPASTLFAVHVVQLAP